MHDLTIYPGDGPGGFAEVGEVLGAAGISINGGGMFVTGGRAVAHFLFDDGTAARAVLQRVGIEVGKCRRPLVQRLDQGRAGELGRICRSMADAGVAIEVMYSDHDNQLILVVDDEQAGAAATDAWTAQRLP